MLIPFTTARSRSCRRCGRSTYVPVDARPFAVLLLCTLFVLMGLALLSLLFI